MVIIKIEGISHQEDNNTPSLSKIFNIENLRTNGEHENQKINYKTITPKVIRRLRENMRGRMLTFFLLMTYIVLTISPLKHF